MAAVTRTRITRVLEDVTDAVLQTTERSTLSGPEQDALLAKACAESCDLFTDWLASDDWARQRSRKPTARVADALPQGEDYAHFLDPLLVDMLVRGGLPTDDMSANAPDLATSARKAVQRMAQKHPRWKQSELFHEADSRVRALRGVVCALATSLKSNMQQDAAKEARRRRAWIALKRTLAVLPALSLMASLTPPQIDANLHVWAHDGAQVVSTYLIAHQAQPDLEIGPPGLSGPKLSPR
jgi:hypothetical protein